MFPEVEVGRARELSWEETEILHTCLSWPGYAQHSVEILFFEVAEEIRERTLRPVFSEAVEYQLNPPKIQRCYRVKNAQAKGLTDGTFISDKFLSAGTLTMT